MTRPYNFNAGPAMLPESILLETQAELLDWQKTGTSILEAGHRTPLFMDMLAQSELKLRSLLKIPNNYHVLFLGGASRTQFSLIPMNLLHDNMTAAYIVSGLWSDLAFKEASKIAKVYCLASNQGEESYGFPVIDNQKLLDNTSYVYYASNETLTGVQAHVDPQVQLPLVSDMTSSFLMHPIDFSKFGLIFAGAQKNISGAGLVIVVVRDDILVKNKDMLPSMFDYKLQADHHSLYATPPTFNCYLAHKMFNWIEMQGGVEALYAKNLEKACRLYAVIDSLPWCKTRVRHDARSFINVCFNLATAELELQFLDEAKTAGLIGLKGHRAVGGIRASLYNAMPLAGVDALLDFMHAFGKKHNL
jgi:phosphoserine aminotransferase